MFEHFHPFEIFINETTTKLIVGTLPPPRFCTKEFKERDVNFCYGSKDNLLWPILESIYKTTFLYEPTLQATQQRKTFLKRHNIGVCDIVHACQREKVDASDLGMKNILLRPILEILQQYPNINTLLFMGGASKNGPEYFLRKVLKKENISYEVINNQAPKIHQFNLGNRRITTYSLISPSNAANRSIGANSYYKEQKIKNPTYTTFDFRCEQYASIFLK